MGARSSQRLPVLLGVLAVLNLLSIGFPGRLLTQWAYAVERGRLQATELELARADEVSNAFRMVAKLAVPAVVHISATDPNAVSDILRFMRERFDGQLPESDQAYIQDEIARRTPTNSGSGFVIDPAGYIVTNNHVVAGKQGLTVRLNDDRAFPARLIGADPKTDLAVLKIDASDLHALRFGDSDAMEVGDWVLAVGAPFGLTHTVTHGIISAKGRSDVLARRDIFYQNFLQTDAAINPGNSGGPLLNMRGEVIGVNTAIATTEVGSNAGVAFTIPSSLTRRVVDQLRRSGKVERGWLGVALNEPSQPYLQRLSAGAERGVLIDAVHSDSPAAKAGLQVEDLITRVNGRPVADISRLQGIIADVAPGESVRMTVLRDRTLQDVAVRVGVQPENPGARVESVSGRRVEALNVLARTLDPERAPLVAPPTGDGWQGVLVLEGAELGSGQLERGDLILSVNDRSVASVYELGQLLRDQRQVELRVLGNNREQRVERVELRR